MTAITSSGASETDRARKRTSGWTGLIASIDGLAAAAGHVDVEEHDVGQALADQLDRGGDLVGFADDLDGVAELAADAGAEQVWSSTRKTRGRAPAAFIARPGRRGTAELDLGALSRAPSG